MIAPWMRGFLAVWLSHLAALVTGQLVQFMLVWWLAQNTGSGTVLAQATLCALLPQILVAPFAGVIVDRWDRRMTLIVADACAVIAILGLAAVFAAGEVHIWYVYAALCVRATTAVFRWPALQASVALMVPDQHLSRIAGFSETLRGAFNIAGPPIGAVLLGVLPLRSALLVAVLASVIALLPLMVVRIPRPAATQGPTSAPGRGSILGGLGDGARYIAQRPGLLIAIAMATVINAMFYPATALLPLLVREHFEGGAMQLAWVEAAWSAGVVGGGLVLGVWGGFRRRLVTSLSGLVGMGIALGVVGLCPGRALGVAVVAMGITGFMNPMVNAPFTTLLQSVVEPTLHGRVFAMTGAAIAALSPLSLLVAGAVADGIDKQAWYAATAVCCLAAGIGGRFVPVLMAIEQPRSLNGGTELIPYVPANAGGDTP
jgi:DHA3 family macrolide efflux protein-like MFS transporter